ncbi:DUF3552 domain-containing protein, partial [bacterium]|nr:DUF3552 domain-containing protein [bacterium]
MITILFIVGVAGIVGALSMLFFAKKKISEAHDLLNRSAEKWKNMKRDIDNERKEALLKVKDEIYKKRTEFEVEFKRERLEFDRQQQKLNSKYEV